MIEFLVALVAIFETWSMVGGQSHLDLMPWYTKLLLVLGLAIVTVMGSAAAVSHERGWNAKTVTCLLLAVMIATAMGAATYYYHLHENDDQTSGADDNSITQVYWPDSGNVELEPPA